MAIMACHNICYNAWSRTACASATTPASAPTAAWTGPRSGQGSPEDSRTALSSTQSRASRPPRAHSRWPRTRRAATAPGASWRRREARRPAWRTESGRDRRVVLPRHLGKPASPQEPRPGARPGLDHFPDVRRRPRAADARHGGPVHDAALAGGRVGDERAGARRDGEPEQHPEGARLRRRRHARGPPGHRALSLHRHQRPRGPPGPERRGHEPRLRPLEAADRVPPPQDRLELQRRPPADRRRVRRPRGRACPGMPPRELHHLRPLAGACARPACGCRRHGWGHPRGRGSPRRGRRRGARSRALRRACGVRLAGPVEDEAARREVPRGEGTGLLHRGGARVPPGAFHRRASRAHAARDDGGHAGALRGDGDAGPLHRAGLRLPEEHALSRTTRSCAG